MQQEDHSGIFNGQSAESVIFNLSKQFCIIRDAISRIIVIQCIDTSRTNNFFNFAVEIILKLVVFQL